MSEQPDQLEQIFGPTLAITRRRIAVVLTALAAGATVGGATGIGTAAIIEAAAHPFEADVQKALAAAREQGRREAVEAAKQELAGLQAELTRAQETAADAVDIAVAATESVWHDALYIAAGLNGEGSVAGVNIFRGVLEVDRRGGRRPNVPHYVKNPVMLGDFVLDADKLPIPCPTTRWGWVNEWRGARIIVPIAAIEELQPTDPTRPHETTQLTCDSNGVYGRMHDGSVESIGARVDKNR